MDIFKITNKDQLSTVLLLNIVVTEYVISLLPEQEGRRFGTVQAASFPHNKIRGGVVMYIIITVPDCIRPLLRMRSNPRRCCHLAVDS